MTENEAGQQMWQQGAVIYQIYPRSFYDAKDTGVGNLQGIIEKLDYLGGSPDSLGVTAIWLSPIYTSPMADFGYDVADYTGIDRIFGNLDDLRKLVSEAHKRTIKVIMDLVPNHTSEQHPWFVESRASLDISHNPKRNWYTWRSPAADGGPPNNWMSIFGGSAWQFDEQTNQYYLHSFLPQQPDLNWDNPEVREAMKTVMRFWLDVGIDGFRVDAVDWLSKDSQFRDDPLAIDGELPSQLEYNTFKHTYSREGPHLFERLNEMAAVLSEYPDRFMITEAHPETDNKIEGYLKYYQGVNPHLSAPFNFEGLYLHWEAKAYREFVNDFQAAMQPGYTPIYTTGNHDEPRVASRIGSEAARTAAMMLLTLPGMAFIYYGEELGMTNVPITPDQVRDPFTERGRDPERTPMLWNNKSHAGFTSGQPWLPVSPNYAELNVATESQDETSMLNLYKQLITYRNKSDVLQKGAYRSIISNDSVYAYERVLGNDTLLVLLNFSKTTQNISLKDIVGTIKLSTQLDRKNKSFNEHVQLRPHEGLLIAAE